MCNSFIFSYRVCGSAEPRQYQIWCILALKYESAWWQQFCLKINYPNLAQLSMWPLKPWAPWPNCRMHLALNGTRMQYRHRHHHYMLMFSPYIYEPCTFQTVVQPTPLTPADGWFT